MFRCTSTISKLTRQMDSVRISHSNNNFKGAIFEHKRVSHREGYNYDEFPHEIMELLLSEPFFTRRMNLLGRPDGFMLYGTLVIDFFSTSELLYTNMEVMLRLFRVRPIFHKISDNPNFSLGIGDCSPYKRGVVLKDDYHRRRIWICPYILQWSTITWKQWQRSF